MKKGRKKGAGWYLKLFIWTLLIVFIFMNIIAYTQAYKFTHFDTDTVNRIKDAKLFTTADKIKATFAGVDLPRPKNKRLPRQKFETLRISSDKVLECWLIKTDGTAAKGTVIIFHGYGGEKSSMLTKSDEFLKLGYNTLLVDFMGSGGSEGNETTIGFYEAAEVKSCFEAMQQRGAKHIILMGTSMGAVAILKAVDEYNIKPEAIIVECPFGTMYETVCARFRAVGAPIFPMASLLMFWGGVQNGYWAFSHNPEEYAKGVDCPALLLYGAKDERVSRQETDKIFRNLKGGKELEVFANAGHENYLVKYRKEWVSTVDSFLHKYASN